MGLWRRLLRLFWHECVIDLSYVRWRSHWRSVLVDINIDTIIVQESVSTSVALYATVIDCRHPEATVYYQDTSRDRWPSRQSIYHHYQVSSCKIMLAGRTLCVGFRALPVSGDFATEWPCDVARPADAEEGANIKSSNPCEQRHRISTEAKEVNRRP